MAPHASIERLRSSIFLAKWRIHDHFRYRSPVLAWLLLAAWAITPRGHGNRWHLLLAAHRQSYSRFAERRIIEHIDAVAEYSRRAIAPGTNVDGSSDSNFAQRAIVLKEPVITGGDLAEKGVLLVKFTNSFVYLQRHFDVEALLERFYLVLEPSWSGYAQPPILAWLGHRHPILVQASEARDRAFLERIGGNLKSLPIGSSDWVDPRVFRPVDDVAKTYDAVLIGDAGLTKRIHAFLHAIAQIDDPAYRCALVMGNWGANRTRILALINHYGVAERVAVHGRMSQRDLNVLLNRSKVNVLLSLKEGSNRALFEGFFAGTPALLLRDNVGVNKDYVNDATGVLVDEHELADKLRYMKASWRRFEPRQWAMENIHFNRSTERIAAELKAIAEREGLAFNGPLYPKVNAPEACYPDDPDGAKRRRLLDEHLSAFALAPAPGTGDRPAPARGNVRRGAEA